MEAGKTKTIVASIVIGILILIIVVFRLSFGVCKTFFVLASIDLILILAIFIWIIIQLRITNQRQTSMVRRSDFEGEELRLQYSYLRRVAGLPTKFPYQALEAATDNFRFLIGRGSSASVFKGILNDGTTIVVKRIEGSEHGESEFHSEVTAIANVQHVNLVRLLGYCLAPRNGPRFLVYEFVHNGSLDKWIFPQKGPRSDHQQRKFLTWPLRYRIAIDVAKALAYLHNDCRSRVLHLDIKPENILLDESFQALVSDFGLSKLMGKDESRILTTIRGTRGYLAPEWFIGKGVSEKCDIFSFGLVLLELVAGQRSLGLVGDDASQREWLYLPRIVMEKVNQGKLMEVVDERLIRGGVEEREVRTLVYVALWCIREEAKLRPSMAEVVEMLQGKVDVEAPEMETEMLVLGHLAVEHVTMQDKTGAADIAAVMPQVRQLEGCAPPELSTYSVTTTVLSGR